MRLAEALIERKVKRNQVMKLVGLIDDQAVIQEGDAHPDIDGLMSELSNDLSVVEDLDIAIRKTNSTACLENGMTLQEAVARRDILKLRANTYSSLAGTRFGLGGTKQFRRTGAEIKFVDLLDRKDCRAMSDEYAQEARILDAQIQEKNWTVDLQD